MNKGSKQLAKESTAKNIEKSTFSTHSIPKSGNAKPKSEPVLYAVSEDDDFQWTIRHFGNEEGHYDEGLNKDILDYLEKLDLIPKSQRKKIKKRCDQGANVADVLIELNLMKRADVGRAIADFFGTSYVDLKHKKISPDNARLLPEVVSRNEGAIVYDVDDTRILVAMINPSDRHFLHLLEKKTGKNVKPRYSTPFEITDAQKIYRQDILKGFQNLVIKATDDLNKLEALNNISSIFDTIILMAYYRDASDIHIEPFEDEIRIRLRVDGVLSTIAKLPLRFMETMVNHVKVLAKLRIDEHNSAQDGRFKLNFDNSVINFRVSILPSYYGEKMVLRLLSSESQEVSLEELGYSAKDIEVIERNIYKTQGMNLVTGPTGSGKTTTLYSLLTELNKEDVNISTIEDPIEYGLYGMNQVQVNLKTNLNFADGLRSLLRQDPDIMMIGEIRDLETAKISTHASLTGHLILATLHTSNASLAPLRMIQMGLDPYMIVSTLNLIVAQRLVRTICKSCIVTYHLTKAEINNIRDKYFRTEKEQAIFDAYFKVKDRNHLRLYRGNGCEECGGSGFRGRTVVAEVMELDQTIRDLIVNEASQKDIEEAAIRNGMTTMLEDGLEKIFKGLTTFDELFRVINQ